MDKYQDRIGIEFISVLGMPPVEFVEVAADLGCRHIGVALQPIVSHPGKYPTWSLREDAGMRHDFAAAMRDRGVSISVGEGFLIWPHTDIKDAAADLDLMCELGAPRLNIVSIDSGARAFDQCGTFAEMAGARGLDATLEFLPGLPICDLPSALEAVRHVGRPNFRVLIDMMHLVRSGSGAADLAALDPNLIGYVQLCDVPLVSKYADYSEEARFDRLSPGDGELPLFDLLSALPSDLIVGLEVPMLKASEAGIEPHQRLFGCVLATHDLLMRVESERP